MTGTWIELGGYWARIDLQEGLDTFVSLDAGSLEGHGQRYDDALDFFGTALKYGRTLGSLYTSGGRVKVASVRSHPDRGVLHVRLKQQEPTPS
jgi:hypothetical protein